MAKSPLQLHPLQFRHVQPLAAPDRSQVAPFVPGAVWLLTLVALTVWMPAASARPIVRVQSNSAPTPSQTITFPTVIPLYSAPLYSPVQTIVQPGFGSGLSVQIGTPTNYPSRGYSSGYSDSSEYIYGQPGNTRYRGSINNSVLINPTVINSPIRNSTLINPTIVTTPYAPYYPAPYYNIQTVTTTTRPEPEVYIDPQYGVRYRSPSPSSAQTVIIYPQTTIYP